MRGGMNVRYNGEQMEYLTIIAIVAQSCIVLFYLNRAIVTCGRLEVESAVAEWKIYDH